MRSLSRTYHGSHGVFYGVFVHRRNSNLCLRLLNRGFNYFSRPDQLLFVQDQRFFFSDHRSPWFLFFLTGDRNRICSRAHVLNSRHRMAAALILSFIAASASAFQFDTIARSILGAPARFSLLPPAANGTRLPLPILVPNLTIADALLSSDATLLSQNPRDCVSSVEFSLSHASTELLENIMASICGTLVAHVGGNAHHSWRLLPQLLHSGSTTRCACNEVAIFSLPPSGPKSCSRTSVFTPSSPQRSIATAEAHVPYTHVGGGHLPIDRATVFVPLVSAMHVRIANATFIVQQGSAISSEIGEFVELSREDSGVIKSAFPVLRFGCSVHRLKTPGAISSRLPPPSATAAAALKVFSKSSASTGGNATFDACNAMAARVLSITTQINHEVDKRDFDYWRWLDVAAGAMAWSSGNEPHSLTELLDTATSSLRRLIFDETTRFSTPEALQLMFCAAHLTTIPGSPDAVSKLAPHVLRTLAAVYVNVALDLLDLPAPHSSGSRGDESSRLSASPPAVPALADPQSRLIFALVGGMSSGLAPHSQPVKADSICSISRIVAQLSNGLDLRHLQLPSTLLRVAVDDSVSESELTDAATKPCPDPRSWARLIAGRGGALAAAALHWEHPSSLMGANHDRFLVAHALDTVSFTLEGTNESQSLVDASDAHLAPSDPRVSSASLNAAASVLLSGAGPAALPANSVLCGMLAGLAGKGVRVHAVVPWGRIFSSDVSLDTCEWEGGLLCDAAEFTLLQECLRVPTELSAEPGQSTAVVAVQRLQQMLQRQRLSGRATELAKARPEVLHVVALASASACSGVCAEESIWRELVGTTFDLLRVLGSRGMAALDVQQHLLSQHVDWHNTLASLDGGAGSTAHLLAASALRWAAEEHSASANPAASIVDGDAAPGVNGAAGVDEYLLDDDLCANPDRAVYNDSLLPELSTAVPNQFIFERISEEPPVTMIHGFLSAAEADHIILQTCGRFRRSTVATTHKSDRDTHSIRTSSSVFFEWSETHTLRLVEERLSLVSAMPRVNMESLQVVRYLPGQHYDAHNDWFGEDSWTFQEEMLRWGGQRAVTLFVYLTDGRLDPLGGTTFHKLHNITAQPPKGTAVLWHNTLPNGEPDERVLHGGTAPLLTTKYGLNSWIRQHSYKEDVFETQPGWAAKRSRASVPQSEWEGASA